MAFGWDLLGQDLLAELMFDDIARSRIDPQRPRGRFPMFGTPRLPWIEIGDFNVRRVRNDGYGTYAD